MKVLIGIPVFRLPASVARCVKAVLDRGADVLIVDNGADYDVKEILRNRMWDNCQKFTTISLQTNTYCNGGWNQIMRYGLEHGYDVIALGTSDVFLHDGWQHLVGERFRNFQNEVILPRIAQPVEPREFRKAHVVTEGQAGFFTFYPRKAIEIVYPIPSEIRHWFGDQYIFEKLRALGWQTVVLDDMTCDHEWSSVTAVTPEAYSVIGQDQVAWKLLQEKANGQGTSGGSVSTP